MIDSGEQLRYSAIHIRVSIFPMHLGFYRSLLLSPPLALSRTLCTTAVRVFLNTFLMGEHSCLEDFSGTYWLLNKFPVYQLYLVFMPITVYPCPTTLIISSVITYEYCLLLIH